VQLAIDVGRWLLAMKAADRSDLASVQASVSEKGPEVSPTAKRISVNRDVALLAPKLRDRFEQAMADCHRNGLRAVFYEGYRSPELQAHYFSLGRTVIPPISTVTNMKTNLESWHGYGLAVDVIHLLRGWDAGEKWFQEIAAIFKAHEFSWGGGWKVKDLPHFQWGTCPERPTAETRELLQTEGIDAVWKAFGAA
jgi:peptidoglycan L-alanyl-D-glutamate endopeptidase CwlK